ncbi:MAG: DMT family transporter [Myxococcales bacterium]|nr:DMT family transporter [Myxococcales bacterium]
MERYIGELAALATAVCWTATAMFFESAGRRVGSLPVNVIRLGLAFVFFCVFGFVARGLPLPSDATPHAWLWLSASGVVGFTLGDLCLFRAWVLLGARLASQVMALVPVITALGAVVFLSERLAWLQWLGVLITTGGVFWVATERVSGSGPRPERPSRVGLLLALGGAVGQAGGLVLSKYGLEGYSAFAGTHIRVMAGLAGFLVICAVARLFGPVAAALRDRRAMLHTSLGAVFGPFLGVGLSLLAVQHAPAGVAATLMALTPVLVTAAVALVRKERISLRGWLGAALAVSGSAMLFLAPR